MRRERGRAPVDQRWDRVAEHKLIVLVEDLGLVAQQAELDPKPAAVEEQVESKTFLGQLQRYYEQAKEAGTTQIGTQVRLLRLKLERGPSSPELYRVSEFAPVTTTGDFTIDHRGFRTFRFLNHWWALVWAEGLQRSSAAAPERAGDSV